MMARDVQQLRHDLRGGANSLMLCCAALQYGDLDEKLEFLDEIESAADRVIELIDLLEQMPQHFAPDSSG